MRILVLGGTAWVGGAIAAAALKRGHEVTCLARGSAVPVGASSMQADRSTDRAYDSVTAASVPRWDAVIDVSSQPGQVRSAAKALAEHAAQYVYLSSCSAYASLASQGIDEHAPLHEPLANDEMTSPSEYGAAKAACEQAARREFGSDRTTVIRPGLIGGPGDHTGRTSYWPMRFARPSGPAREVLVPESGAAVSVIDVRDLAAWVVLLIERRRTGAFNAVGHSQPLADHLAVARKLSAQTDEVVTAPTEWLVARRVAQWVGPRSLPLWVHDPEIAGIGALSNAKALAAGLKLRPLAETLFDTLQQGLECDTATMLNAGLTDAEERELLAELLQAQAGSTAPQAD